MTQQSNKDNIDYSEGTSRASYTRLIDDLEQEQQRAKRQVADPMVLQVSTKGRKSKPLPVSNEPYLRQEQPILIFHEDQPNIEIHFSANARTQTPQKRQSRPQPIIRNEEEKISPRSQLTTSKAWLNSNYMSSGLKSIQERSLENKQSDSSEKGMLQSKIERKMVIMDMNDPSLVKKSARGRDPIITGTFKRSLSPVAQSSPQQVFIRPIDDSTQLNMQQEPFQSIHKNVIQYLQSGKSTLRYVPVVNEEQELMKESEQGRGILSSLVTLSKKKQSLNSNKAEPSSSLKKQEKKDSFSQKFINQLLVNKLNNIEKLVEAFQTNRENPSKFSQSKYPSTASQPKIIIQESIMNKVLDFQINANTLRHLLRHQLWKKLQHFSPHDKQFNLHILTQILLLIRVNCTQMTIIRSNAHQIKGALDFKPQLFAVLTPQKFYLGTADLDDKRPKQGLQVQPDKYLYAGYFQDCIFSDRGTIAYADNSTYSGTWETGKYQSQGTLYSATGELFQGYFVRGLKSGKGSSKFANKDSYQGQYLQNLFHGKGVYKWSNGSSYKGEFKAGNMHGKGHWVSYKNEEYIGEYKDNVKDGWGKYRWNNGKVYEGYFRKGKRTKASQQIIAEPARPQQGRQRFQSVSLAREDYAPVRHTENNYREIQFIEGRKYESVRPRPPRPKLKRSQSPNELVAKQFRVYFEG